MPKLNIYVDDDLLQRIKRYGLPISGICQDALWEMIEVLESGVCAQCGQPADFHVRDLDGLSYTCKRHLAMSVAGGTSTVRATLRRDVAGT